MRALLPALLIFPLTLAGQLPLDVLETPPGARAPENSAPGKLGDKISAMDLARAAEEAMRPPERQAREELPTPPGDGLRFLDERSYQVTGYNYADVQAVASLCREAERALGAYLRLPEKPPVPLLVQLVDTNDEIRAGPPYWMSTGEHNNVIISIRWDEQTSLRDCCEALTRGLLRQGLMNMYEVPYEREADRWLVCAFGLQTYLRLQSVRVDELEREGRARRAMSLQAIFEGKGADAQAFAGESFWLLRALMRQMGSRTALAPVLERLALEDDPFAVLNESILGTDATRQDAELWWAVSRQERLAHSVPRVQDMDVSRELMAQNTLVPIRIEGADLLLSVPELWPYRKHPGVLMAATDRMRVMRTRTNMMNPVWFNSALSFSEVLQHLISGNEKKMNAAYERFTQDLQDALALEETINAELDKPLVLAAPSQEAQPGEN